MSTTPGPRDRFLRLDAYRVDREWKRYEGTPQRDLFRELRSRFLQRHVLDRGWSVDLGCGPGRFLPSIGGAERRRIGLDLSREALLEAHRRHDRPTLSPNLVRGDALRAPVRDGQFHVVVGLGNVVGFAGVRSGEAIDAVARLARPGGRVILEIAPGDGERSRYLARLPAGAVRRLLAAPVNLVRSRIEREGFAALTADEVSPEFQRAKADDVAARLQERGLEVREVCAVAPTLGSEPSRIAAVREDPRAWARLLEVEEAIGRSPARHARAAAILVAAERKS